MYKRIALILACTVMARVSLGQHSNAKSSAQAGSQKSKEKKSSQAHYGTASYYANKFDGRKTASGEIFSQQKLTAACNTIGLNTWVKVTNLRNKKNVIVKINDRMHPKNKRLIDLSHAAAKQLGYTGHGLAKVKVEVLGNHKPAGWTSLP
jgi:rare lipoprotein A